MTSTKQMSHFTCAQKETAHHTHLHDGQHTVNTSYAPPTSWQRSIVRPQMDNTHREHNQQSTEDTKDAEKKPQTSPHNFKIAGIQNNSQNLNMQQPSGTHIRQKICTTLTTKLCSKMGPS